MLTLAVDTTAEFGSVALTDRTGTREEILLHSTEGFSGILFAQIEALLSRNQVALRDIELFAAASGPGSFTGVRIGLAAMKGLGDVLGKPVAAVSNLAAVASFGEGDLRAALIDARRGEVYAGLFDQTGRAIVPETVLPFPRLLERLEAVEHRDFTWVSSDFEPFLGALAGTRFEHLPVITAPRALAAAIARLAVPNDPVSIEANYVRRSDAELFWKG